MNYRRARPGDWGAIERLLADCALPIAGARENLSHFIVCEDGREICGCVGAEVYGTAALLRSLAVRDASRGRGIGQALVDRALARLKAHDAASVALLTTTADAFFAKLGFEKIARAELPAALQASQEFQGACPAGATAMLKRL